MEQSWLMRHSSSAFRTRTLVHLVIAKRVESALFGRPRRATEQVLVTPGLESLSAVAVRIRGRVADPTERFLEAPDRALSAVTLGRSCDSRRSLDLLVCLGRLGDESSVSRRRGRRRATA